MWFLPYFQRQKRGKSEHGWPLLIWLKTVEKEPVPSYKERAETAESCWACYICRLIGKAWEKKHTGTPISAFSAIILLCGGLLSLKGFIFHWSTQQPCGGFYLCLFTARITSQPPHTHTGLSALCQSKGDKRHNTHLLRVSACCLERWKMEDGAPFPPHTRSTTRGHLHTQEAAGLPQLKQHGC